MVTSKIRAPVGKAMLPVSYGLIIRTPAPWSGQEVAIVPRMRRHALNVVWGRVYESPRRDKYGKQATEFTPLTVNIMLKCNVYLKRISK